MISNGIQRKINLLKEQGTTCDDLINFYENDLKLELNDLYSSYQNDRKVDETILEGQKLSEFHLDNKMIPTKPWLIALMDTYKRKRTMCLKEIVEKIDTSMINIINLMINSGLQIDNEILNKSIYCQIKIPRVEIFNLKCDLDERYIPSDWKRYDGEYLIKIGFYQRDLYENEIYKLCIEGNITSLKKKFKANKKLKLDRHCRKYLSEKKKIGAIRFLIDQKETIDFDMLYDMADSLKSSGPLCEAIMESKKQYEEKIRKLENHKKIVLIILFKKFINYYYSIMSKKIKMERKKNIKNCNMRLPEVKKGESSETKRENSILQTLINLEIFEILIRLVELSDLDVPLKEDGPYTIFAPNDETMINLFEELSGESLSVEDILDYIDDLEEGEAELDIDFTIEDLIEILKYHAIEGNYLCSQLPENIETIQGEYLSRDDIDIESCNIIATNGIIHTVNNVLIPPSF